MNPTDPKPETAGLWIPTSLAMLILDCYFGGGPRHQNRAERAAATKPAEPLPAEDPGRMTIKSPIFNARPMGAAARHRPTPSTMTTTDPAAPPPETPANGT